MRLNGTEGEYSLLGIETAQESRALGDLFEIAKNSEHVAAFDRGPLHPDKYYRFEQLMTDLFPGITPTKNNNSYSLDGYDVYGRSFFHPNHNPAPVESITLDINARICHGEPDHASLVIAQSPWRAVIRTYNYRISPDDDLVDILGLQETPPVRPFMQFDRANRCPTYILLDVDRLPTVKNCYEKATHLLEHASTIAGATREELITLRKDASTHPNLFIRLGSKQEYDTRLHLLARESTNL